MDSTLRDERRFDICVNFPLKTNPGTKFKDQEYAVEERVTFCPCLALHCFLGLHSLKVNSVATPPIEVFMLLGDREIVLLDAILPDTWLM